MRVLAVVVLYKQALKNSRTLLSLDNAFGRRPELLNLYRVLLWDNSPVALDHPTLSFPFEYIHSSRNVGSSGAFNYAMKIASEAEISWLLLLDQDTGLPECFLPKMAEYSYQVEGDPRIAAVVPLHRCRGQLISPKRMASCYRLRPLPKAFHGDYHHQLVVCDSATLMRVTALRDVGGYDEDLFWLDFSDIHVFATLHREHRSVYVASDLELDHSLAMMDYDNDMTPARYANFLAAEAAFFALYGSFSDDAWLTIRLAGRVVKQFARYKNKNYAEMTRVALCRRLLLSKAQQAALWELDLRQRDLPSTSEGLQ